MPIRPDCRRHSHGGHTRLPRDVREYTKHYHLNRNQQRLENELIDRCGRDSRADGPVECRERLGGMLRYYQRAA